MVVIDEANETLEELELLIGKDNARKVFELFEGENIYFPKRIGLAELHNQIFIDLRNGAGYGEVARKYHYSKSYIRKIEQKKAEQRRQMRKAGIKPPEIQAAARPMKPVKPVKLATMDIKLFSQGELFYED
jgi:hypothetical protein